jgi:hypothetical protein
MMREGAFARLPENRGLSLLSIRVRTDERGFMTDWAAEAVIYEGDRVVQTGTLGPNSPLFYHGMGVYLKHLSFESGPAALLVVAKDPGAVWALVGGVLFILGSVTLLVLKWKKA